MRLRRETYAGGKRGANEKKSNKKKLKKGSIMEIATTEVVTAPLTSTIMSVLKMMVTYSFRRVPVVDPGTKRLEGIITGTDVINFFGGGEKHRIVEERYDNNLLAAINEDVREIMERNVTSLEFTSDWEEAVEIMLEKNVGGCPVVDREERVVGIVTERDMLEFLASQTKFSGKAEDFMTRAIVCIKPETTIEEAMRTIISRKIRRLPVVEDGILLGLITSSTLLRYFGSGEAFRMLVTGDADDILRKPIKIILSDESIPEYRELLTFPPEENILVIAKKMIDKNHGAALIMKDGLEGLITERDLVDFLYRALKK
ncbi:MAG TPA: CBS domain-containing protein [Archaeoglobaceae archaeon]|nr:CBS domain-containing protein [Archaeoglobaceae archaeon]